MDKVEKTPLAQFKSSADHIDGCIKSLTAYATNFAVSGQEDKVQWLYGLIEDMLEFWGLEVSEQYLTNFEQMISQAYSSGQAAILSEQSKTEILAGLKQYEDEMRTNGEEQDAWFIECSSFIQDLKEQWHFVYGRRAEKPDCALIGEDGNIFNLCGIAVRTLRESGLHEQADELQKRIYGGQCGNYYDALRVIGEYVYITGNEEHSMQMGGM